VGWVGLVGRLGRLGGVRAAMGGGGEVVGAASQAATDNHGQQ
jgi:hypothetical protein